MGTPKPSAIGQFQSNPRFRRFLVGNAMASLALTMGQLALTWWIASVGGARDLALYAFWAAVVGCIATPLLAALGDRHDRRRLIRVGLAVNVASAAGIALMATVGHYAIRSVLAVAMIEVVGVALAFSLINVAATDLFPPAGLPQALQQQQLVQSASQLGGPLVAGAVLAVGGVAPVLWLQAVVTLLASVVLVSGEKRTPAHEYTSHWLVDVFVGIRVKWRIPLERNWTAISFLVAVFLMPCVGLLLPLKVRELGLSGRWFAAAEAALSVGLLTGAAMGASNSVVKKIGRYRLRFLATSSLGPAFILTGLSERPPLLLVSLTLAGMANSIVVMMGYSRRILASPPTFRARMTSTSTVLTQVASIIGPGLAGFCIVFLSAESIYITFGTAISIASVGYLLTPGLKRFLDAEDGEMEGWYIRYYPKAFH